jgi:hypothetical protein
MEPVVTSEIKILFDRFFTMLRSIDEYNEKELRGILMNQVLPTLREQCFLGNYLRSIANVKTLLKLTNVSDCQAVAMIARSIFETAIEIALIDKIDRAPEKIVAFSEYERLRYAKRIIQFVEKHPDRATEVDLFQHKTFVDRDGARIDARQREFWPNGKPTHWSQRDLRSRAELVGDDILELYDSEYQIHSWYVHGGITGVINTREEFYVAMCGNSFRLAAESYEAILESMITVFQLYRTDSKLRAKLEYAKGVPFTEGTEQATELWKNVVG